MSEPTADRNRPRDWSIPEGRSCPVSQSSPRLSPGPIPPAGPGKHHRHRAGLRDGASGLRTRPGAATAPRIGTRARSGAPQGSQPALGSDPRRVSELPQRFGAAAGVGIAPGFRSCPGARSPECRPQCRGRARPPRPVGGWRGRSAPVPVPVPLAAAAPRVTASSRFCAPPHRAPAERCRAELSGSEPRQPLGPDVVTPAPGGRACPSAGDPGKSVRPHPHFPRALALSLCE